MPLEFNSDAKRVEVASNPSLEGMSGLFVCAWIYRTGTPANNYARICSKSNGGSSDDYSLTLAGASLANKGFGRVTTTTDIYEAIGTTIVPINTWHWMAMKWDGSEVAIYYDNQEEASPATTGTLVDNNSDLGVGGHVDSPTDRRFPGWIDDVRVYNRAISDTREREAIFRGGGKDGIRQGLVLRLLMNEKHPGATASGSGSIIDISGQGNHGTPIGSPVYKNGIITFKRKMIAA